MKDENSDRDEGKSFLCLASLVARPNKGAGNAVRSIAHRLGQVPLFLLDLFSGRSKRERCFDLEVMPGAPAAIA